MGIERNTAPKIGRITSLSILLDDFQRSWRTYRTSSRRNAFIENVDFLFCVVHVRRKEKEAGGSTVILVGCENAGRAALAG